MPRTTIADLRQEIVRLHGIIADEQANSARLQEDKNSLNQELGHDATQITGMRNQIAQLQTKTARLQGYIDRVDQERGAPNAGTADRLMTAVESDRELSSYKEPEQGMPRPERYQDWRD